MFQSPGLLKESIYSNYRKRDSAWFCLDHMAKPGPVTESSGWSTLASLNYMLGCGKGSMLLQGPWDDGKKRQFFCFFLFLPEKWGSSLDRQSSRCLLWEGVGGENSWQQELLVQGPVAAGNVPEKLKTSVGGWHEGHYNPLTHPARAESFLINHGLFVIVTNVLESYR